MAFEMLLIRICHLVALPNLKEVLLDLNQLQNSSPKLEEKIAPIVKTLNSDVATTNLEAKNVEEINDDVVNEILRNFEGSKIV